MSLSVSETGYYLPRVGELTQIKAAHESNLGIDDAQLLMVCPEQHHIIAGAIQGLQGIASELGQVQTAQGQVFEAGFDIGRDVGARHNVIRVPKHFDIGMQCL